MGGQAPAPRKFGSTLVGNGVREGLGDWFYFNF